MDWGRMRNASKLSLLYSRSWWAIASASSGSTINVIISSFGIEAVVQEEEQY